MDGIKKLVVKYKRPIMFVVIGGINTVVDFLFFKIAGWVWPMLAVKYCQVCGYSAGIICSFILNQLFTFKDAEKGSTLFKVIRFLIVNIITMLVSMYAIEGLVGLGLNRDIAKIITTCVTMVTNYLLYKVFVFRVKGR